MIELLVVYGWPCAAAFSAGFMAGFAVRWPLLREQRRRLKLENDELEMKNEEKRRKMEDDMKLRESGLPPIIAAPPPEGGASDFARYF